MIINVKIQNIHYLVVLLQTTEGKKVVTYYYHLIEIGLDESAQGLVDALIAQLKEDGLYVTVRKNLVAFVSDKYFTNSNIMSQNLS